MSDRVVGLTVPAEPSFARTVRMLASNLAVVCGMDVDDVDEVRMAAEEGFVFACATNTSGCKVAFSLDDSRIDMTFSLGEQFSHASEDEEEIPDALRYADLLLSAVCDEYEVDREHNLLRLAKVAGGTHAE